VIVIVARAVSTFLIGGVLNALRKGKEGTFGVLDMKTQIVVVAAGLKGPVALALVTQMPTSSGEQLQEAVLFIIFWTNILLGGATTPLVRFLGLRSEVEGTLDLGEFEFTEEEADYLSSIEGIFARLEEVLLIQVDNPFSTSTGRGRHASLWESKINEAKKRGAANLKDRVALMPEVKKAQKKLDEARADKMPGKSEAARAMVIKDLEKELKRQERLADKKLLDSSTWDVTQAVSESSQRAEQADVDNPVYRVQSGGSDADPTDPTAEEGDMAVNTVDT
jgi:hypothetical protein